MASRYLKQMQVVDKVFGELNKLSNKNMDELCLQLRDNNALLKNIREELRNVLQMNGMSALENFKDKLKSNLKGENHEVDYFTTCRQRGIILL